LPALLVLGHECGDDFDDLVLLTAGQARHLIKNFLHLAGRPRNGRLLHNPAERLAFPRKEQPLPHVLNESEITRLIETPDTGTALGIRDRALMETLYATGIRHAEAHRLDLYDVDTAAHRLIVRLGKGQRDRLVPLTETAAYWLTRYVTAARPELAAGQWWGKGRRRGQPKLIPPTSALWLAVTGPSSLVSNDRRAHP
jgi:site-specific recombinase XerD